MIIENNNTTLAVLGKTQDTLTSIARNIAAPFHKFHIKGKKLMMSFTTMIIMSVMTTVCAFAAGEGEGTFSNEGEDMFNSVIEFFATWIGRIGLVVAFIGAIQFALAIKNDDADAKTRGLMTMASGFVVFAVTKALNLFGIDTGII